jgi:hypothetical protein
VTLTRLVTKFTYRIEPKVGGGFIAHASDPNVPPLEAATREELQVQIRARIAADLAREFPGLKVPLDRPGHKFEFHIEAKPSGGFTLHSADPNALPIDGATHDDLQRHVVEKLIGIAGQPDAQPGLPSGDVLQPIRISSTLGPAEAGGRATVVRVVLTMIAIAAVIYFFVSRR